MRTFQNLKSKALLVASISGKGSASQGWHPLPQEQRGFACLRVLCPVWRAPGVTVAVEGGRALQGCGRAGRTAAAPATEPSHLRLAHGFSRTLLESSQPMDTMGSAHAHLCPLRASHPWKGAAPTWLLLVPSSAPERASNPGRHSPSCRGSRSPLSLVHTEAMRPRGGDRQPVSVRACARVCKEGLLPMKQLLSWDKPGLETRRGLRASLPLQTLAPWARRQLDLEWAQVGAGSNGVDPQWLGAAW